MTYVTSPTKESVQIQANGVALDGDVTIPGNATGIVLFAHGSGSSRHSPRNRLVAQRLNEANLATLLFDLLTAKEEAVVTYTAQLRFDIVMLADRLAAATDWVRSRWDLERLRIGYFGASTGGGAALVAAKRPDAVFAVVSRGGRPDLAADALAHVQCPTLLIVGQLDQPVIEMNRSAMRQMKSPVKLEIVPGATHLFEEPGALEIVADLAANWFQKQLASGRPGTGQ